MSAGWVPSVLCCLILCAQSGTAQVGKRPALSSRVAISGGMGVEYISAPDVVDYVNAIAAGAGATQRVAEIKSGAQFFGAVAFPLSVDLVLKAEYVYLIASYNPNIVIGSSEFTLTTQMPSVLLQYVLWDEGLYNVKAGGGLGYHFSSLTSKYAFVDEELIGNGIGGVIGLEANTAFGDHFFGYLGADLRWEFIGKMRKTSSVAQLQPNVIAIPTMQAFAIGARLGFSFYF